MLRVTLRLGQVAVAAVFLLIGPTAAYADDGTVGADCTQSSTTAGCDAHAGTDGEAGVPAGGSGGGGVPAGDGKCRDPLGAVIPCARDGGSAGADGCYYRPVDPSPETMAGLGGQPSGAGGWYMKVCYTDAGTVSTAAAAPVWVAGAAPVVSPDVLARQARSRLNLPQVVLALSPAGDQLVGLPTWLALDPASWTTQSATAAVPGVSVTATARPVTATWVLGDGSTVVCTGAGTSWKSGMDPAASTPDCGYRYIRSSAGMPNEAYRVTVTVGWQVTWMGAGASGTVPGLVTTGVALVRVGESQAIVTR